MRRFVILAFALVALIGAPGEASAVLGHSFGIGLHYLRNISELDEDLDDGEGGFDQNSFGLIGSYQFGMPLVTLEGNVEYVMDYVGSDHGLIEPSAYVLTSGLLYLGAGIGIGYIDGDWQSDPFYALRGGVNFGLAGLALDVYASYRFQQDEEIEDLTGEDLDSLTLAAVFRFGG
jgi:hypothetical protein